MVFAPFHQIEFTIFKLFVVAAFSFLARFLFFVSWLNILNIYIYLIAYYCDFLFSFVWLFLNLISSFFLLILESCT